MWSFIWAFFLGGGSGSTCYVVGGGALGIHGGWVMLVAVL